MSEQIQAIHRKAEQEYIQQFGSDEPPSNWFEFDLWGRGDKYLRMVAERDPNSWLNQMKPVEIPSVWRQARDTSAFTDLMKPMPSNVWQKYNRSTTGVERWALLVIAMLGIESFSPLHPIVVVAVFVLVHIIIFSAYKMWRGAS